MMNCTHDGVLTPLQLERHALIGSRWDLGRYTIKLFPTMGQHKLSFVHKLLCPGSLHDQYHKALTDASATLEIMRVVLALVDMQRADWAIQVDERKI